MNPLYSSNASSLWGYVLARTIALSGVRQAVLSPGSRSTPIVWALAHCESIETLPVLDERGAAFYALGLARQSGRPVVLACTSGTATANYLPALVEARESGIPLLVLTADRPPELRRCSAGQTVDQVKMYGSCAVDYFELPVPEPTEACMRQLRQTLLHALDRTMFPFRGPVHVNCPLREPLAPSETTSLALNFEPERLLEKLPAPSLQRVDSAASFGDMPECVSQGLIIAGTVQPDDESAACCALWSLAARTGWPVLCDALGPWRFGDVPDGVVRVSAYDAILGNESACAALEPDFVFQVGPLPTSKNLRRWLSFVDAPTLVATTLPDNLDAAHARSRTVCIAPERLGSVPLPLGREADYGLLWAELERMERGRLDAALDGCGWFFEGLLARELYRSLPEGASLFVANSMSVRDAESFAGLGSASKRIFFNRGANGIDGTIATALGCVHGGRGVLLCGDLAFLHDAGSLLAARQMRGSLTIVLCDNHGGGIFGKLPVASLGDPVFESYFSTPQEADFAALGRAYGAEYQLVDSLAVLQEQVSSLPELGLRILHVKTDRVRDMAFRKSLEHS